MDSTSESGIRGNFLAILWLNFLWMQCVSNSIEVLDLSHSDSRSFEGYRFDHGLGYLISFGLLAIVGGAAPSPGRYMITLALVSPFGHVPHLIRAILRSFQISYFSTDLLMSFLLFFQSFCFHTESTMRFGSWLLAWDPGFLMPFLWNLLYYFPKSLLPP